jgi:hypothetical protein
MHTRYDIPDNYYFSGGTQVSTITLLALVILLASIACMFMVRRRQVVVPFLLANLVLPVSATIVVGGLHFLALRLLILAGWLRLCLRGELSWPRWTGLDKAVMAWACVYAVAFTVLWGNVAALTNRLGFLWNTLGAYLLLRILIRDKNDVVRVIKALAVFVIVVGPFLLHEHITGHNAFNVLGAEEVSAVRNGTIRAMGPFSHPIIAGTIGAMLAPLFIGLWWQDKRQRWLCGIAIASSLMMTVSAGASTPMMTFAAGVFALLLWSWRTRMRFFRRALVAALAVLQLVMKAPVWMLIARTGGAIGGSGYHRSMLIDNFIHHVGEWWLVGTQNNADWGYDMWDVDNAFVAAGVGGGLLTFLAFIALVVYAYKQVGKSRILAAKFHNDERLVWALGACLFANTVGFFGIVYFDQSVVAWYALLAMISATATVLPASGIRPQARWKPANWREQAEPVREGKRLVPGHTLVGK